MRIIERLRAWAGGYWWKECPMCGRHFGGHESGWMGYGGMYVRTYICPRCTAARRTSSNTRQGNEDADH